LEIEKALETEVNIGCKNIKDSKKLFVLEAI